MRRVYFQRQQHPQQPAHRRFSHLHPQSQSQQHPHSRFEAAYSVSRLSHRGWLKEGQKESRHSDGKQPQPSHPQTYSYPAAQLGAFCSQPQPQSQLQRHLHLPWLSC